MTKKDKNFPFFVVSKNERKKKVYERKDKRSMCRKGETRKERTKEKRKRKNIVFLTKNKKKINETKKQPKILQNKFKF